MASEVLIVGGGLSGLAAAFYLGRAGIQSTIIEKSGRLGGLIKTDRMQGCELEAGADSFISIKTAVADLARDLDCGLSEKMIESNDAARRIFVVRNGKLTDMPKSMSMMVPGAWRPVLQSPLLGVGTKLRLLGETFKRPLKRQDDFSVGELTRSHFGSELLEYIAEPLLSGVYGGEAAKLSARSVLPRFVGFEEQYGSLIKGVRASAKQTPQLGSLFRSFEGGMQTLIDALAEAIQPHTSVVHAEVTGVERAEEGWRVHFSNDSLSAKQLVMACPAWAAAALLQSAAPALAGELADIPYSSALLTMLVFDRKELNHPLDGFGFLVPRRERQTIAAATWVNIKFPSRVPPGMAALRGFILGETAEALSHLPRGEVVQAVCQDFKRLMHFRAQPLFNTVYLWPKSMPQYVVGHEARIGRVKQLAKTYSGLRLTGNYLDGVGIPDTIRCAKEAAKQIGSDGI